MEVAGTHRSVVLQMRGLAAGFTPDSLHDVESEDSVDGRLLARHRLQALVQRVQHLRRVIHLPCKPPTLKKLPFLAAAKR